MYFTFGFLVSSFAVCCVVFDPPAFSAASDRLTATHIRQTTPDTNMIVEAMHIVIKPVGLDDSKAGVRQLRLVLRLGYLSLVGERAL